MTDSENFVDSLMQSDLPETFERVRGSTATLGISTASFAKAISRAFADATAGGKQFDDVLKQLALRLSKHGADASHWSGGKSISWRSKQAV
jgi:hypothetical protein